MLTRLFTRVLPFALVLSLATTSCSKLEPSDDDAPSRVPADIRPEDATFRYVTRNQRENVLVVRLSRANFCDKASVPAGQSFVEIDVAVPLGATIPPGTYGAGFDGDGSISLLKTSAAECSASSGAGVSSGTITLTEVSASQVRGTFQGKNPDSKLDLQGSFVANACLDEVAACL